MHAGQDCGLLQVRTWGLASSVLVRRDFCHLGAVMCQVNLVHRQYNSKPNAVNTIQYLEGGLLLLRLV